MIVVDIGCATRAGDRSIVPLLERFNPDVFYGFDPGLKGDEDSDEQFSENRIVLSHKAAWVYDGLVGFEVAGNDGIESHVQDYDPPDAVPCFDLATFIADQPEPVVLKLDCEGAEHVLLPHLIETGAIGNVRLLLVEFHGPYTGPKFSCPWEVWW